jgi:hypothetical protein
VDLPIKDGVGKITADGIYNVPDSWIIPQGESSQSFQIDIDIGKVNIIEDNVLVGSNILTYDGNP